MRNLSLSLSFFSNIYCFMIWRMFRTNNVFLRITCIQNMNESRFKETMFLNNWDIFFINWFKISNYNNFCHVLLYVKWFITEKSKRTHLSKKWIIWSNNNPLDFSKISSTDEPPNSLGSVNPEIIWSFFPLKYLSNLYKGDIFQSKIEVNGNSSIWFLLLLVCEFSDNLEFRLLKFWWYEICI